MSKLEETEVSNMEQYLQPGVCIDSDHPEVRAYALAHAGEGDDLTRAINLYKAVRDDFLYNTYTVELTEEGMKASAVLSRGNGFCITKAALLAACCRVIGIPARLGFADVRNHLASQKLLDSLGTDVFVFHGYADIFLENQWVKATPAFNLSLCERFGVLPLEFDGRTDSVFHPYDVAGKRHMEYLKDRGTRADVPVEEIRQAFLEAYPKKYDVDAKSTSGMNMEDEVALETGAG
jgi:transglutaminase-like putative cysteine protease